MDPTKIIVRMPNWLGDAIMATTVFPLLRARFPHAHIAAQISSPLVPVLEFNPHINEVISFLRNKKNRNESNRIRGVLREKEFTTGILLTASFSSAWDFFRSHIPTRIGYPSHLRRLFLTDPVEAVQADHQVVAYCRLLSPLAITAKSPTQELFVHSDEIAQVHEKFAESRQPFIGINPGAAYGSAKCWPAEYFISLTKKLVAHFAMPVIFFGDSSSKPLVDSICKNFQRSVVNLAGKTSLRELIALFSLAELIISNDSGPMHVRAAFKKNLIAIFGSTDWVKTRPFMDEKVTIIRKDVFCSPCCLRTCPLDFRCMNLITSNEVFEAAKGILQKA